MGKNQGKDLQEGKLTLPLISALRKAGPAEKARVESIFKTKRFDEADFEWVRRFPPGKGWNSVYFGKESLLSGRGAREDVFVSRF